MTEILTAARPTLVLPIVNIEKAWYTADAFGTYDDHPNRARDWNLETFGNTDYGEPLQAPCDGWVVFAGDCGGGHGIVISFVGIVDGLLVNWHWKHLADLLVRQWQQLYQGDRTGTIGTAGGQYAAHLHEEVLVGAITGPTHSWKDPKYNYVDPAQFYIEHGVDRALVERMYKFDGK